MTSTKQGVDQPGGAAIAARSSDLERIAPLWHTAALIGLIAAVSLVGTLLAATGKPPSAPAATGKLGVYLPMLVVPWMLTAYVAFVGRERGAHRSLATLLGRPWSSFAAAGTEGSRMRIRSVVIDVALGLAVAASIFGCERALAPHVDAARAAALAALLPRTVVERVGWLAVAASVAFGEEVVYRGYLQTQLGALTRRPWLGVILQALLFGVAHLEQGLGSASRVALYGLAFGVLVRARRSVLPAILAHVLIDAASAWA